MDGITPITPDIAVQQFSSQMQGMIQAMMQDMMPVFSLMMFVWGVIFFIRFLLPLLRGGGDCGVSEDDLRSAYDEMRRPSSAHLRAAARYRYLALSRKYAKQEMEGGCNR